MNEEKLKKRKKGKRDSSGVSDTKVELPTLRHLNFVESLLFKLTLIFISVLFTALLFFLFYDVVGFAILLVAVVVPVVVGWTFGSWAGLLTGVFMYLVNSFLLYLVGGLTSELLFEIGPFSAFVFAGVGFFVGSLSEIGKKLRENIARMKSLRVNYESEKNKLNLIVSSMGEGLLVVNPNYEIEMINSTAARLFGIEEEDAIGKSWYKLVKAYHGNKEIPLKKRVSVQVMDRAVTVPTQLDDDHYYFVEKSGRKFPIVSVTTPIFENDKVVGAVKVFKDASVEKEARIIVSEKMKSTSQELATEQIKTHAILENTNEGVVLTDSSARITYVNPSFLRMTGIEEKALIGREFPDAVELFTLKQEKLTPAEISDAAAVTAKKREMKVYIKSANQSWLGVVVNSSPVHAENKFVGVVRMLHDFTEEIHLQQQKDDFFSIASHELKTPLSVIAGNLDTVLSGYGKSEMSNADMQLLQDSMSAADRLTKMVTDFLNISRIDQGMLKYQITKVDSCAITEEVAREMESLVEKKGIKLTRSCTDNPRHKYIMADENLYREVLINLIGNSLKFTENGEIKIEHLIKDNMLQVKVSDTGIGIAKDKQKLLFQRFQQAMNKTLSREAGGTGLGLYISREFVRIMGGDLILESSEPGKGTTFSFTLPLAES